MVSMTELLISFGGSIWPSRPFAGMVVCFLFVYSLVLFVWAVWPFFEFYWRVWFKGEKPRV